MVRLCTVRIPPAVSAKMLINAGVQNIVYGRGYPDELAYAMLKEAGIQAILFEGDVK